MDAREVLRGRIQSCLDRMGRYHIFLLGIIGIFSLIAGHSHTVVVFYTYTPKYFCGQNQIPPVNWNTCGNVTDPSECQFDLTEGYNSIVTEFFMICSQRYLSALSTTLYFAGVAIGALLFGNLADRFGRRPILLVTTLGHLVTGSVLPSSESIGVFISLRFLQGSFAQGMQTIGYTSLIEFTPMKYRTLIGCVWEVFWATGLIYVGVISKFQMQWTNMQYLLQISTTIAIVVAYIVPESLHWLSVNNRAKETIHCYTMIARRNGDKAFLEEERELNINVDLMQFKMNDNKDQMKVGGDGKWSAIFKNWILRKHILIMSFFWFIVTMSYYVITFYLPSVAGDRHVNFILGACVEIIAYFVTFVTMQRFGRPKVLGVFMILYSFLCVLFAVLKITQASESDLPDIIILLLAKGFSVSGFCGMYIFTGELFPTACRGTVFGVCGFCSRVGSLIAPQLVSWAEVVNHGPPMFLLGGLLLVTGSSMFTLPETLEIQIINTIAEVDNLWGRKRLTSEGSLD